MPDQLTKHCLEFFESRANNPDASAFYFPGLSSLGVPGVPWHPQILANQLTLSQPGGADYVHYIDTGTPGFSDLPTALLSYARFNQGPLKQVDGIATKC